MGAKHPDQAAQCEGFKSAHSREVQLTVLADRALRTIAEVHVLAATTTRDMRIVHHENKCTQRRADSNDRMPTYKDVF
eukprot:8596-Heterococcus_DN1.PRE.2